MGRVYIIGSGPGDPGLIAARGVRLLAEADVVVYDRPAEPALRWARADAERIAAGGVPTGAVNPSQVFDAQALVDELGADVGTPTRMDG